MQLTLAPSPDSPNPAERAANLLRGPRDEQPGSPEDRAEACWGTQPSRFQIPETIWLNMFPTPVPKMDKVIMTAMPTSKMIMAYSTRP